MLAGDQGGAVTAVPSFRKSTKSKYDPAWDTHRLTIITVMHQTLKLLAIILPWAFAAGFLLVACLLFWRERECAAVAETGRAEPQTSMQSQTKDARNGVHCVEAVQEPKAHPLDR